VQEDPLASENLVLFMFVISIAIGFAIGLMMSWHLYLTLTNQVRCCACSLVCAAGLGDVCL
jgi:hypothetical protein